MYFYHFRSYNMIISLSLSLILQISYPPKLSKLEFEIGKKPTHSDYKLDFKYLSVSSFIYKKNIYFQSQRELITYYWW